MVAALRQGLAWLVAWFLILCGPAWAGGHMALSLISDSRTVPAAGELWLGIKEAPAPGWHTYWRNPGDTGMAPDVEWHLPAGVTVGDIQWPAPKNIVNSGVITYGYDRSVVLLVRLHVASGFAERTIPVSAHVSSLVCADVCEPAEADVSLQLRTGIPDTGLLRDAITALPKPLTARITYQHGSALSLNIMPVSNEAHIRADFAGHTAYVFSESGEAWPTTGQTVTTANGALTLRFDKALTWPVHPGSAVIRFDNDHAYRVDLAGATPEAPKSSQTIWVLLGLAFVGGMILNFMPCVFPVLSMKLIAIARTRDDAALARYEALAYAAGVIGSFVVLAAVLQIMRSLGAAVGWGFQLQSPIVVALLSLVMVLVALNLNGVFSIGGSLQSLGGSVAMAPSHARPLLGSFLTGALAVVVAAPCTAPFMATAIGAAITQGGIATWLIFVSLGAGFALPFAALAFLFSVAPALARFLPRPGKWMDGFRHILALPMYAAAGWMVWVFSLQVGMNSAICLAACLVAIGVCLMLKPAVLRGALLIGAVVLATASIWLSFAFDHTAKTSETDPFSVARLDQLRGEGRPVFVDLTAAWCITCKVNETVVLKQAAVQQALRQTHTAYLVGDWTRQDAAITSYLSGFGRSGVPLYAYYAPGARQPRLLPQILTVKTVTDVLRSR